ncbi:MAG: hypothetical protein WD115_01380 [Balneolaceae bacterium]
MNHLYARIAGLCAILIAITSFATLTAQNSAEDDYVEFGGALRYNFYHTDYGGGTSPNDTQFTMDTWRLNVVAQHSGVGLNFEYRFYPTFNTHFLKQGWIDYMLSDRTELQVGVTQVPFGNLPYNSHNWWFQGAYYVGLEDDHDTGFKLIHTRENWDLMVAYFIQPEPGGPAHGIGSYGIGGPGRYSYDIIPVTSSQPWGGVLGPNETGQSNQEKNQFNLRSTYTLGHAGGETNIGGSLQYGGIYNSAADETGNRTAWALHTNVTYGNWNLLAQYSWLSHDVVDDLGNGVDYVYMAAYGDAYPVATDLSIASIGLAYSLDVNAGPLSNLQFYNNYSYFDKRESGFETSHQNVLGVLATVGNIYAYFDIASGVNHPWLNGSFGSGLDRGVSGARMNTRFNINIGYYF